MLSRWLWRILVGMCFAFPVGIVAAATAEAQTVDEEPSGSECEGCHEITQSHWSESAHANSVEDPDFQKAWREQGSPTECLACHTTGFDEATGTWETESVSCSVCHGPEPNEHPEQIMPTDISSRMCGTCHLDTHAEWEGSIHGQEDLACVRCHNPHTTDLRAEGVQTLCQSCHNEVAHFYSYTAHADEGLLCSDCHLRVSDAADGQMMGEGHGQRVHAFTVDLDSCSQCHEDEMHYPGETAMTPEDDLAAAMGPSLTMASVVPMNSEPDPVSPFGFAVLASLVGMGFGIVVAPWLEKWNRRVTKEGNKDE